MGARIRRRSLRSGGQTYEELVLADGAIAYWPLGEGATDTDHTTNARDLTWDSTPTSTQILTSWTGGITGANASLARNPAATTDTWITQIRTVEAWVKFNSTSFLALASCRNATDHFAVYHSNTNGIVLVTSYNSGILTTTTNTGVMLNDDVLHHVVVTFGGGAGAAWNVYVDGALSASGTATFAYVQGGSGDYITVGSEIGPSRRWVGQLGHVACYSTQISPAIVAAHNTLGRA